MSNGLIIDPGDQTVVVTITSAGAGALLSLYSDINTTTTTTNPLTVTSATKVFVKETVQALVSLKINSVEYGTAAGAALPYTFGDGEIGTCSPAVSSELHQSTATGTLLAPTATKTAAYAVAVGEQAVMNVAGGATALTLPAAPADKATVGYIAVGATQMVPLVITAGGSDTIGTAGATSATVVLAGQARVLQYQASTGRWLSVVAEPTPALDARFAALGPRRVYVPPSPAALPTVMTQPPTVGYSTGGAATTITNPAEHAIQGSSGLVLLTGAASFTYDGSGNVQGTQIGPELPVWQMAFVTDAPSVDIVYLGSASPGYRLVVDGQYVTQGAAAASGGSGLAQRIIIRFSGRKFRRIVIESASLFVKSITTAATDSIYAAQRRPYTFGFLGDSYVANGGVDGIAPTAAKILGAEWMANGSGGTGYNNSQGGAGGKQVFSGSTRLTAMLAATPVLDGLVIAGGINDGTSTLSADVTSLLATAKAVLPANRIFVVGPFDPPSQNHTTSVSKRDTIQTATLAAGCQFIDNIAAAWIGGTGNTSSLTLDGNADIYIGPDGTHPSNPDGYIYHGVRLGQAIAERLAA